MDSTEVRALRGYKQCAGKGCQNIGTHHLWIRFIHKSGLFCDSCKNALLADGLLDNKSTNNDSDGGIKTV
jgi:hypothetical protein